MFLAIIGSLIFWPIYLAVSTALHLIGLVLIALLAGLRLWTFEAPRVWPRSLEVRAWKGGLLTWLWGNEEDGVLGPMWWQERQGITIQHAPSIWRVIRCAYRWSALRNPTNNLRFLPWVNPVIDPKRVQFREGYIGRALWVFTYQGPFAGIIAFPTIKGRTFRFWLGWKLKPEDQDGVPETDFRRYGCGFAVQFKRVS